MRLPKLKTHQLGMVYTVLAILWTNAAVWFSGVQAEHPVFYFTFLFLAIWSWLSVGACLWIVLIQKKNQ